MSMNKSLYRKTLSILLASCMTLGTTASALPIAADNTLAKDATSWVDLQPAVAPQADVVTPPAEDNATVPMEEIILPESTTPTPNTATPPATEPATPSAPETVVPPESTAPSESDTTPLLPLTEAQTTAPAAGGAVAAPENSNLARIEGVAVKATASDEEDATHTAAKVIDGDRTGRSSRWATKQNAEKPTITIDLGVTRSVQSVFIYWEAGDKVSTSNAENYVIQTSNVVNPSQESDWTTQETRTQKVEADKPEHIKFQNTVDARHIRVRVDQYSNASWKNISMYELEVYQEANPKFPETSAQIAEKIQYEVTDSGLIVRNIPAADFTVEVGANYEQVIGTTHTDTTADDGTLIYTYPIYQPLVNMDVELDITVTKGKDVAKRQAEKVNIPGRYAQNDGNTKPAVVPELTEWYSSSAQLGQTYSLTASSRIVADGALSAVAAELQQDISDLFGYQLEITSGGAQPGDIVLRLDGAQQGFDKETYTMDVQDSVTITATDATGVYWGTRSVLQALKLRGDNTIEQGTAKDYPEFKVRGFMLDVGRKPMSMEQLKNFAKNMAWYKMNDFHIHLSDNLIFMEDYAKTNDKLPEAWNAYDGFRLESNMKGPKTGRPLASPDYHYSKQEFGNFIKECAGYGINVVPELDVPAHALSFTKILKEEDPNFVLDKIGTFSGTTRPWIDHVNIANKQAVERVKDLFREYIESTEQAFGGAETVIHIGADEFYDSKSEYRKFLKEMIRFIREDMHRQVRVWGSLSTMNQGPFDKEDVRGAQMNIWALSWSNPQEMLDLGFNVINTLDIYGYIVPSGAGGHNTYGDFLNVPWLYKSYSPNQLGETLVSASDDQMLGGAFAIWQDNIDTRASGLDEQDTFYRFMDALPTMSLKMWGEGGDGLDRPNIDALRTDTDKLGVAPNSDPYKGVDKKQGTTEYASYDFDSSRDDSGNDHTLRLSGASLQNGALSLRGGSSYAETDLDNLTWGDGIHMRVKKTGDVNGQAEILFEGAHAYGDYAIKALPGSTKGTWRLGFSRELYDYTFEKDLPIDQWVDLSINSRRQSTVLVYAGREYPAVGAFKSNANSNSNFKGREGIQYSSFCMPVGRIGSTSNAFVGELDFLKIGDALAANPINEGKYDVPLSDYAGVTAGNEDPHEPTSNALDDKPNTNWHTAWGGSDIADSWITLELKNAQSISGFRYLPRQEGINGLITKYRIETSMDNTNWTAAAEGSWSAGSRDWQSVFFDAREAKYIRLTALETRSDKKETHFASAAEIRAIATPSLDKAVIELDSSYTYAGSAVEPNPPVLLNGYKLAEGVDYTLSYTNHTGPGTATITVTGKGVYTGTISAEFTISGRGGSSDHPVNPEPPVKPAPPVKPDGNNGTFSDVSTNDWFYPAVTDVINRGLMNGVSGGNFAPQDTMTRAMLVTVLHRLAGEPSAERADFNDVPANAYYSGAVAWAEQQGIVSGVNDTIFAPSNMVTREQIATMLYRYAKANKLDMTASGDLSSFTDAAGVSSYATEALRWAVGMGLINGDNHAKLNPSGKATRAETAAMLSRFAALTEKK